MRKYLIRLWNNYYLRTKKNNKIWHSTNIYQTADIGRDNSIGSYTEIGDKVRIGSNNRIGAHCFIPWGVSIGDNCFIGPGVTFTNDKYPPGGKDKWEQTFIEDSVSIGARAVILPGIKIGKGAKIGAGAVVTKDVEPYSQMKGVPARQYKVGTKKKRLRRNEKSIDYKAWSLWRHDYYFSPY